MNAPLHATGGIHGVCLHITHRSETDEPSVDLSRIAAAIAGDAPQGENLIYDDIYDEIKENAREDDPNLPQGVWVTDLKRADWEAVQNLCSEALFTRSKDIQVASWLMESLIFTHGFAGAIRGLRVIDSLITNFWDTMYPQIEDDDLDFRLAPFYWIDEKLPSIILRLPIVAPQSEDYASYCTMDWNRMLVAENEHKKNVANADIAEAPARSDILKSFSITSDDYYQSVLGHLAEAKTLFAKIESALANKCGNQTPYMNHSREAFSTVEALIASLTKKRLFGGVKKRQIQEPETPTKSTEDSTMPKAKPAAPQPSAPAEDVSGAFGEITSREDAYQRLTDAADYLLRTEPHSPTPYLIKRAVRWGSMPFHELLEQFVDADSRLNQLSALLGLEETGMPGMPRKSGEETEPDDDQDH